MSNVNVLGFRAFATSQQSGPTQGFPKHKEYFNDMYYKDEESADSTAQKDYIDPNEPFVQDNPFVPGGILANYKKRQGLNARDVME